MCDETSFIEFNFNPSNDKYDIQPQKETRHKSSIIPSFPGIANEGLTAKKHDEDGRIIRPTVERG